MRSEMASPNSNHFRDGTQAARERLFDNRIRNGKT